jgi:protein disulfide isomerase family A protein 3
VCNRYIVWLQGFFKHSVVLFQGGREVDDFIKYIAKHATNELKGWDRKGKPKKEEL